MNEYLKEIVIISVLPQVSSGTFGPSRSTVGTRAVLYLGFLAHLSDQTVSPWRGGLAFISVSPCQ